MRKKFTLLIAACALLTLLIPITGWGQTETLKYTLDGTITGGTSSYAEASSITQSSVSWSVMGNTNMNPWRIGGKNLSSVDRPIYSTNAISDNISKITIEHGTASNITVNSMTVTIYSTASDAASGSSNNIVASFTPTFTASSTVTITKTGNASWAGCYYRIVYNVTVTDNSNNRFLQFKNAKFYEVTGGSSTEPSISGTAPEALNYAGGTGASFEYTVTNPVSGGTVSATVADPTNSWISNIQVNSNSTPTTVSFDYAANPNYLSRTETVTLTYTYNTNQTKTTTVTVTQNGNPTGTGSSTNPYTVAQAIANTPATGESNVVYVTGIVYEGGSSLQTSGTYNGAMNYWISDDGTATDKFEIYRGKSFNGAAFTSTNEVQPGDVVTVSGKLTKYGSTYEFAAGSTLQSLKLVAPTFSPAAGAVNAGTQVTISDLHTTGTAIYYTTNGDDPTTSSNTYSSAITVNETMTIKAIAVKANCTNSDVASATYTVSTTPIAVAPTLEPAGGLVVAGSTVSMSTTTTGATIYYTTNGDAPTTSSTQYTAPVAVNANMTIKAIAVASGYDNSSVTTGTYVVVQHAGTQADPYTVADARIAIDANAGITDVYVTGIVSEGGSSLNSGAMNYWISDDGTSTNNFEIYKGKSFSGNDFTNVNEVRVGDVVIVSGDIKKYNSTYEFNNGSTLQFLKLVAPTFSPAAGEIEAGSTVAISDLHTDATIYYTTDGTEPTTSSTEYAAAITVNEAMTIKAIAVKENCENSNVVSAAYTVTAPAPVINASDINIAYDATSGEIAYTITNPDGTSTLGATTTADWISNITVASDKVTFTTTVNEGNADRTATITLSYAGAANKVITVTQGHYVKDYADLPFAYDGNGTGTLPAGLTVHGTGTYSSSPKIKFDDKDSNGIEDYVILKINETPGVLTFKIKGNSYSGGTFKVETSANGTDYSTKVEYSGDDIPSSATTKTISDLASSVRYIKWSYTKDVGNVAFGDINLAAYVDPSTVPAIDASDVDLAYDATDDYIVYSIDNYQAGTMSANTEATWISNIVVTPDSSDETIGEVTFDVTTNNSTNSRTGIITLTFTFGNSQTVTKDVTVTQAGKPAVIIESPVQLTAAANDNGTIDVTYANFTPADTDINLYDDQECTTAFSDDWFVASFATVSSVTDFNHIDYMVDANTGAARTVYMKVEVMDANSDMVFTVVSITQAAYSAPGTWVLTNLAELTPADVFVIVGTDSDDDTFALPNDGSGAPAATSITIDNGELSVAPDANLQWNIRGNATDGYTFYPVGSASTWLYCSTTADSKNNDCIRVGTGGTGRNKFVLDVNNYLVTKDNYATRYLSIYVNSGTPQDWRGYLNTNNNPVAISFYKKVSADVTYTKENIVAYTGARDHYYLIASPVASVAPTTENGFLNGTVGAGNNTYDLYYFDQMQQGEEWRNYEATPFNLVSGKGYLYANGDGTNLTFTGQPYNGNGIVVLDFDESASPVPFNGWNLIGNPFGEPATLDQPYYRLNTNGDALNTETEEGNVAVMEGVFVLATSATRAAVFTPVRSSNGNTVDPQAVSKVNIKVMRTRGGAVIDNAILRFDNGSMLDKFVLNENSTKLYISQEGNDYAIVNAQAEGEMPLSFKAEENGNYIIAVELKDVEMNYLHLIDNMTGADVDLLATPSYSFEARTTDYASRFRLVFSANNGNNENGNETFAYYNGSEWVISNMGEATLQVVDVMGRVLSSETVSGNANVSLNQTPGVYMLRLVNNENVRTQKIVVR